MSGSTEDITESYDEDSPEALQQHLLRETADILNTAGSEIVKKLRKIVQKADQSTKEAIDGILAANVPEGGGDSPGEKLVYACALGQMGSDSEYYCTPSCLEGFHLSDMPECNMSVYEKKDGAIRCVRSSPTYRRACLYVVGECTERDFRKVHRRAKYQELFVYFYDDDVGRYVHTLTRGPPVSRNKTSRREESRAATVLVVLVIIIFLIALAIWLRCNSE